MERLQPGTSQPRPRRRRSGRGPSRRPTAASHRKAVAAQEAGKFKAEIAPVEIKSRKGSITVDTDEGPRKDSTAESLGKLRPAFTHEAIPANELSVTAGNASSLNDGASALVVTSEEYARAHGLTILARINQYATGGTA